MVPFPGYPIIMKEELYLEQDVFMAGVRPGSPASSTEIKMLLCYLLSRQDMHFQQILDALSEDALVNYFELVAALDALCVSGHLSRASSDDGDRFAVTALGRQAGDEFASALPASVRERAQRAAARLLARERRIAELEITTTPAEGGGFHMRLAIPEQSGALVSFTLFVPNEEQCGLIRRRFLNAPGFIYKSVLALLTGDRSTLDEAFPAEEDRLF